MSAAEVVEITQTEISRVRDELALKAESVARERLDAFEDRILERFEQEPELREAFADPDFQYSLRDASRAAASNDDQHTEDLLVDLLANRAEQGNGSRVRLATSLAIRAADKLSLDALKGLTAQWAVMTLMPSEPSAMGHIASITHTAACLAAMGLPKDPSWTEDAEALSTIRSESRLAGARKPFRQMLTDRAAAYLNPGINAEGSRGLIDATPGCGMLPHHPLRPGYVVLPGTTEREFRAQLPAGCGRSPELDRLVSENGFGVQDPAAVAEFTKRLNEFPLVAPFAEWWDQLPVFDLTLVGKAIGFVNTRRHVPFDGPQTIAELLEPLVE